MIDRTLMLKKKKVCYILPFFNLETDTHHLHLYDFINEVTKDLDLVLLIEKSSSDLEFFKNVSKIYRQRFSWMPLRIIENFFLLLWIRLQGVKTFYIHYSYIAVGNASLIARLSGAKTFYWSCGMMWLFGEKRLLKLILKMVSHLVTGVNVLADGYAKHYNISRDKIKIMPNWIDLNRFKYFDDDIYDKYDLQKGEDYILYIHRLAKRKGAHYIAKLARNNPELKFLIAGDGPYKKDLKEDIKVLNNVLMIGKIPNKDVPSLMKISKLFFMPSEEEGFPRVLLESMAAGLPYVAYDIGGVREISSKAQQEYIVDDVDAMNIAIKKLLNNQDVYNKLQQVNLEHVGQFDIKVVKNKFIKLIYG